MGKSKQPTKKNPAKKKGAAADPPAALEAASPSKAAALIVELLSRHPPITDLHRSAFGALVGDDQADELGKRTRAADVLRESLRWAVQMDQDLRAHPGALRYNPARFVHFLERGRSVHEALEAEEESRKKRGKARGEVDKVRDRALAARRDIEGALRTFAGQRAPEREELKAALRVTDTNENLVLSLTSLVQLGKSWLDRGDAASGILREAARLTPEVVAAAADAAKSLHAAVTGASMEGAQRATDTPAINRAEGRLMFEMVEARRVWSEAAERTGVVQKLQPGPSIRHIFVRTTGARGEAAGEEESDDLAPAQAPVK